MLPQSPYPDTFFCRWILQNPVRRWLTDRKGKVNRAGITEGSKVLEPGCGVGFFTEVISKACGKTGKVYCQDVQEKMISEVKKKINSSTISGNVETYLCPSWKISLPDSSIDVAFCVFVMEEIHEEGKTVETAKELSRLVRPGGTLYFEEHTFGGTKVPVEETLTALQQSGFALQDRWQTLWVYGAMLIKIQ